MPDSGGDGSEFTGHLKDRLSDAEQRAADAEARATELEEKLAAANAAIGVLAGGAELEEPPLMLVAALASPSPRPFQGVKLSDKDAVSLRRDRPPGDPSDLWRKLRAACR